MNIRPFDPGHAQTLATQSAPTPCISIYLPLSPGPDGFERNRLRLKNLVAAGSECATASRPASVLSVADRGRHGPGPGRSEPMSRGVGAHDWRP